VIDPAFFTRLVMAVHVHDVASYAPVNILKVSDRYETERPVAGGATAGQRFEPPIGSVREALHTGMRKSE
jgi:hypothetical protein